MSSTTKLLILLTSFLFLFLLISLLRVLHKYWWIPFRLQHTLSFHGNNKEAAELRRQALSKPMAAFTHDIFPRVHPQIHSWINIYGKSYLSWEGSRAQMVIAEPELSMIPAVIASAETMLEKWRGQEGKEIEVFEEFSKIWKTADDMESDKLVKEIHDCVMDMVKKREEKVYTGESDSFGSDFLGLLLNAYHDMDEKTRISVEDLVAECKTFYFAGQNTTNSLLAWTVLLLAIHTDWQEKARREVIEVFGDKNPHSDGIAKLKTMNMIINETLRLYPPVAAFLRKVGREVQMGRLKLPVNMEVMVPTMALHHDPELWGDDVHLFKPERFAQGIAEATKYNAAAFIPFGLGPRSCLGMSFATTETKIALSMILQRYTINLSPAYIHAPFTLLMLRPQRGIQVMLHSLHSDA